MIFFLESFFAGCVIGFGGMIFLSVDNRIIGSLLFSFGLLTIIAKQYRLYTGQIAFLKAKVGDARDKITTLIFNMLGVAVVGLIAKNIMSFDTSALCALKLSRPLPVVFFLALFCGALMYLAVSNYNSTNNALYVIMPIMIFILCGFEHCIANVFYFVINGTINVEISLFFVVSIVGNSLGSILWYQADKYINKKVFK